MVLNFTFESAENIFCIFYKTDARMKIKSQYLNVVLFGAINK